MRKNKRKTGDWGGDPIHLSKKKTAHSKTKSLERIFERDYLQRFKEILWLAESLTTPGPTEEGEGL